jgi:hypothetical protein
LGLYLCIGIVKEQYEFVYNAAAESLNWQRNPVSAENNGHSAAASNEESAYYNIRPNPASPAIAVDSSEANIYVNTSGPGCLEDQTSVKYDGQNMYENF